MSLTIGFVQQCEQDNNLEISLGLQTGGFPGAENALIITRSHSASHKKQAPHDVATAEVLIMTNTGQVHFAVSFDAGIMRKTAATQCHG